MTGDRRVKHEVIYWNASMAVILIVVIILASVFPYYPPPYVSNGFMVVVIDVVVLATAIVAYAFLLWWSWPILRGRINVGEDKYVVGASAVITAATAVVSGISLELAGAMFLTKPIIIAGPYTTMAYSNALFGAVIAALGAGLIALGVAEETIYLLHEMGRQ